METLEKLDNSEKKLAIKVCSILLIGFAAYYTFSLWHIIVNVASPRLSHLKSLDKAWLAYVQISIIIFGFGAIIVLFLYSGIKIVRYSERFRKIAIFLTALNFTILYSFMYSINFIKITIIIMSIIVYFILLNKKIKSKFR